MITIKVTYEKRMQDDIIKFSNNKEHYTILTSEIIRSFIHDDDDIIIYVNNYTSDSMLTQYTKHIPNFQKKK